MGTGHQSHCTSSGMDLQALLAGLQAQQGQASAPAPSTSLQFRAGTMQRRGTRVTADTPKGHVRVYKDENQLTHFTWKQRTKQVAEMDLTLFPGEAEVFPLPQPPATGRCFALRLKEVHRIHFFWFQEPNAEKDEELMRECNTLLGNEAPSPASAPSTSGVASDAAGGQSSDPSAAPVPPGDDEEAAALEAALAMSMGVDTSAPAPAPADSVTDEEAELQAALAMSMQVDEPSPAPAPAPAPVPADDEEDAALQAALAMSMQQDAPPADDSDSDLYD